MKTIRVAFIGWWNTFDVEKNLIYKLLSKHYNVELCEKDGADYSICSLYNNDYIDAPGVRIFYTAEAIVPDFTLFDYAIGFDEIEFGDRYIRLPNYMMNLKYRQDIELMKRRHLKKPQERDGFCGWVCSNGNGDKSRDLIFDAISKYKHVDSAGRYRNNIGLLDGIEDKRSFQKKYKFALAIENTSYRGYTTEKLIEAFAAGGIPIYWGDPTVSNVFNEKAFINLMKYDSIATALERIKELDQNQKLFEEMLSQPALKNEKCIADMEMRLDSFLMNIFEQPIDTAYRRPMGLAAKSFEETIRKGVIVPTEKKRYKGFLKKLFL